LLEEALETTRKLGENNPSYADSLLSLGRLYRVRHDTARALPLVKKAAAIYESAGDLLRTTAWDELGLIAIEDRKYATARDLISKSLDLNQKMFGSEHVTVARGHVDLAQAYAGERRYTEARDEIQTGLTTEQRVLGETHYEVARSHVLAAEIETALHHQAVADEHFRAALAIYRRNFGENSPEIVSIEHEYQDFSKHWTK